MTRPLRIGGGILLVLFALSVLAPWVASSSSAIAIVPFGPLELDQEQILTPPSTTHWLGTDQVGRDLLSRLLHGGRQSLVTGLTATLIAVLLAALLGAAAGARGGLFDTAFCRMTDIVYAFPVLVGAIAILGQTSGEGPGLPPSVRVGLVIGIFSWPVLFRFVRSEVRRWARSEFAASARAAGAPSLRLAFLHLLPAAAIPALVPASFIAAGSILAEAGLGFLGLGMQPPEPSWGNLILDGMKTMDTAWWMTLFPGLFVFATVLAFQLLGEGLRRYLAR